MINKDELQSLILNGWKFHTAYSIAGYELYATLGDQKTEMLSGPKLEELAPKLIEIITKPV